jgi:outer membrane protein TolC
MRILLWLCLGLAAQAAATDAAWLANTVPAAWHSAPPTANTETAHAVADWWQRFNDPLLSALVREALQANTSVRSAQAALLQARAQRDVQQAGMGLSLSGSGSARRSQTGSADASNSFQAGFDASWEPDVLGRQRSALDASEADVQASLTQLGNVQVSLAAEVAVTVLELRGLQTRLALAQRSLAAQSQTLQITRWRAQAGLASALELGLLQRAVASQLELLALALR